MHVLEKNFPVDYQELPMQATWLTLNKPAEGERRGDKKKTTKRDSPKTAKRFHRRTGSVPKNSEKEAGMN